MPLRILVRSAQCGDAPWITRRGTRNQLL